LYHLSMRACVIIPTCNRPKIVRRAIESVLRQNLLPGEIIVVNDGSEPPDLSGFPPLVKTINSGQVGLAKARMTAVVESSLSCDCFGFLDDDDEYLPNHLSTLVPLLECSQFAFSKAIYKYQNFETTDPEPQNKGPKRYYDPTALLSQNVAPVSCFMIRRKAFEDVGGFDPEVARLEDWDLWGRMKIQHGDPLFADSVTNIIHKDAGDNMSDANPFAYSLMCKWRDIVDNRLKYLAQQQRGMMTLREREDFRPARVSVVLPVYNAEKYLRGAVESILRQSHKDFEVIAINDGSTDKSREILASYGPPVSIIDHPSCLGVSKALNDGIMRSIGKYIARMDADDISHENRLEVQVRFMDNNRDVFVAGSEFVSMDDELKKVVWENKVPKEDHEIRETLKERNCMGHPTVIIRRKLFEKIGGYDESPSRRHVEDYDLWVRAAQKFKLANLGDNLLIHRVHPNQITKLNQDENIRNAESVKEMARRTL